MRSSSHVAALGLAFYTGDSFPAMFRGGAFVGEHGSWNRTTFNGYRVVFIRFAGGKPVGKPMNFVTGFLDPDGNARGRPVGVAVDRTGALLIADDVGNTVWRVSYAAGRASGSDVNHRDRRREPMATRDDGPRRHPRSTAKIGGHPIHPMLIPFPIVCFIGDLRGGRRLSPEP